MQVEQIASELADREAIRDVLVRYSRGIDRIDSELIRSVYWDDGIDDHGNFKGSADEFVEWVVAGLRERHQTSHFLGNIFIRIEGANAAVETYFNGYHRERTDGNGAQDVLVCGRYIDRMEKRRGEWRIAHRQVAFDWFREFPDAGDWAAPPFDIKVQSNRFPSDVSYEVIRGIGAACV